MSNLAKNACPTERVIIVGNISIVIHENWRPDMRKKDNKRMFGGYKIVYGINLECKFGKSSISEHYEIAANNIEDVVEYLRNVYRGKANPWEGLGHIVPYSWE